MSHTPGPWILDNAKDDYGDRTWEVSSQEGTYMAYGIPWHRLDDARLVAAAPDLLAALRQAAHALNVAKRFTVGATNSYAIAADIDRAIAKAEGRDDV